MASSSKFFRNRSIGNYAAQRTPSADYREPSPSSFTQKLRNAAAAVVEEGVEPWRKQVVYTAILIDDVMPLITTGIQLEESLQIRPPTECLVPLRSLACWNVWPAQCLWASPRAEVCTQLCAKPEAGCFSTVGPQVCTANVFGIVGFH